MEFYTGEPLNKDPGLAAGREGCKQQKQLSNTDLGDRTPQGMTD